MTVIKSTNGAAEVEIATIQEAQELKEMLSKYGVRVEVEQPCKTC